MGLKENQINVIEMLARNEEALSRLYRAYADKFPDYKDFWSDLADEEIEHSNWLRGLCPKIQEDSIYFNEGRFKPEAIQTFLNYLERELAKAREQEMLLINALSTALYIEEALIERKYFEVIEGDSVGLKHVLLDSAAAEESHVDRVRKVWSKHR
jgi:rubrerythrin